MLLAEVHADAALLRQRERGPGDDPFIHTGRADDRAPALGALALLARCAGASADAAPSSGLFAFVVAFVDALRASASDEPPAGGIFPSSFSQNDLSAIAADDGVGMREGGIWRVPSGNLLTAE